MSKRTDTSGGRVRFPRCVGALIWALVVAGWQIALPADAAGQPPAASLAEMLARAEAVELDTEYVAPPGDPLSHHIAGFAKTLCSAVFVTGLDADFAAESVGFFSGPYEHSAGRSPPARSTAIGGACT